METTETKREDFLNYLKNFIASQLENYLNCETEASELGWRLTEGINVDGSATCSTYEAKQYIKLWFDECGEYLDYELSQYGENKHNPFESPEAFQVCMIIDGVNSLLSQVPAISNNWDKKIKITKKLSKQITEYLNNVNEFSF